MSASSERQDKIFFAALGLKDAARRKAFLDRACGNDPELRAAVEALLAVQPEVEKFFAECSPGLTLEDRQSRR